MPVSRPKGSPKVSNSGRKKGVPNKTTATLKGMILGALDKAGGQEYLYQQALNNPNAFCTLIGKVLPTQITAEVNATVRRVARRIIDPKDPSGT